MYLLTHSVPIGFVSSGSKYVRIIIVNLEFKWHSELYQSELGHEHPSMSPLSLATPEPLNSFYMENFMNDAFTIIRNF